MLAGSMQNCTSLRQCAHLHAALCRQRPAARLGRPRSGARFERGHGTPPKCDEPERLLRCLSKPLGELLEGWEKNRTCAVGLEVGKKVVDD
jgi:hypothetical protein